MKIMFVDFIIIQKTSVNFTQPGERDRVWITHYRKVNTIWIEGQVVKKVIAIMYDVKRDCNNSIILQHVDQLHYILQTQMIFMTAINNINLNHESKLRKKIMVRMNINLSCQNLKQI